MNRLLALAVLGIAGLTGWCAGAGVAVEDGWFVVNGERFFVRGIGYSVGGGRWGYPWDRTFDRDVVEHDIARMKAAGFNTVRNWNAYTTEELELFRTHGLMVIQGSWFHFGRYLRDPDYARESREALAAVVRESKRFDNILFYTIANEPRTADILDAGMDAYVQACRDMKAAARAADPECRVTFSHMSANELLDQSVWDVVFLNSYMYVPNTVTDSLTYRGHIEWLMRMHARGTKPFVIGEFGLSVSPDGPGRMGYGGNTLEEQRDGCLAMYRAIIEAGAQGGCLFHWRDGWFKFDDPKVHSPHPEEWYGILGIENEASDPRGTPRPVYHAFREYNRLIVTEPRRMVVYRDTIPLRAFVTEDVANVRCRVDDGPWLDLVKTGSAWWTLDLDGVREGLRTVTVEGRPLGESGPPAVRTIEILVGDPARLLPTLTLRVDKPVYAYGETAQLTVRSRAPDGTPLPGLDFIGTYRSHRDDAGRTFAGTTDDEGMYETAFPLFSKPTLVTLAVGADVQVLGATRRLTDATGIEVTGVSRAGVEAAAAGEGRELLGFDAWTDGAFAAARGRVLAGAGRFSAERVPAGAGADSAALRLQLEPDSPGCWGYTEVFLDTPRDVSGDRAISLRVRGDGSGHSLKVLLVDEDRERWLDEPIRVDFTGWRRIVFGIRGLSRDPFDGIANGDGRPNPERLAGVAFAVEAGDGLPSTLLADDLLVHE